MERLAVLHRALASLGLLAMALAACQPAAGDPGAYEVVGLIADDAHQPVSGTTE